MVRPTPFGVVYRPRGSRTFPAERNDRSALACACRGLCEIFSMGAPGCRQVVAQFDDGAFQFGDARLKLSIVCDEPVMIQLQPTMRFGIDQFCRELRAEVEFSLLSELFNGGPQIGDG